MGMSWRCSLVLNLKWSLQLLFLWAHTTVKPVLPVNLRRHIKGQGLVFFILKILDFVLPGAQSVPMQENCTVSLLVFTHSLRSEMRHLRCFTAFLVFSIYRYAGKFWFQKVNTMSLWALHFYEGGNKKDKCYSWSWICLLSFPPLVWSHIRGYLGHFYFERENNGNLIWDLCQFK